MKCVNCDGEGTVQDWKHDPTYKSECGACHGSGENDSNSCGESPTDGERAIRLLRKIEILVKHDYSGISKEILALIEGADL